MNRTTNTLRRTALALMLALSLPAAALATGQVGEPAADFSLQEAVPGGGGPWHTFSDHDGKVRFLVFFGYG